MHQEDQPTNFQLYNEVIFNSNTMEQDQLWDLSSITSTTNNQQQLSIYTLPHSERGIAGFVLKLYQCLQSTDNNPKYIRWCEHNGKDMFIIDCIPEFTRVVLPRLFKHCKFSSFVRQLNIYGFQRDTDARKSKDSKDKSSCRWYHPCFKPNRRDLFHLIRRKAATRYIRKKKLSSTEEDPDTIINIGSADEYDDDDDIEELENDDDDDDDEMVNEFKDEQDVKYNPPSSSSLLSSSQLQPTINNNIDENSLFQVVIENPLMNIENLKLELYNLKLKYNKTQEFYQDQLNLAKMQINQQQKHIRQLEYTLNGITKSLKQQQQQQQGYILNTLDITNHNPNLMFNNTNGNYSTATVTSNNNNNNNQLNIFSQTNNSNHTTSLLNQNTIDHWLYQNK